MSEDNVKQKHQSSVGQAIGDAIVEENLDPAIDYSELTLDSFLEPSLFEEVPVIGGETGPVAAAEEEQEK